MTEPRKGLREAIDALPFRRMTGAGLDEGGTTGDLSCDYDEWLDVVSKDDVLALAATPDPAGLDVERLYDAFIKVVGVDGLPYAEQAHGFNAKVAAEYAALAAREAAPEEGT